MTLTACAVLVVTGIVILVFGTRVGYIWGYQDARLECHDLESQSVSAYSRGYAAGEIHQQVVHMQQLAGGVDGTL